MLRARFLVGLAAPLVLGACGFHPLYAPSAHTQAGLSEIYVDIIPNRNGQLFRQALQDKLQGTDSDPQQHYVLSVSYALSGESIGIRSDNSSTRKPLHRHRQLDVEEARLIRPEDHLRHRPHGRRQRRHRRPVLLQRLELRGRQQAHWRSPGRQDRAIPGDLLPGASRAGLARVKIETRQAAAFLRNPAKTRAILLHGDDEGLIRDRGAALTKLIAGTLNDPFQVAELDRDGWPRLADEMSAISMMGGRRVVRVRVRQRPPVPSETRSSATFVPAP